MEIEAEGEEENFRLFLKASEGPRFAYVENLEINKMADLKLRKIDYIQSRRRGLEGNGLLQPEKLPEKSGGGKGNGVY